MAETTANPLTFYAYPGVMTTPGEHAALLQGLPEAIPALCAIVQQNLLHVFWAERYGAPLSPERRAEVNIRRASTMLARIAALDSRLLTLPRPVDGRLVGNCRHFAVMLATLLRHQGIPARARCGFGAYFTPGQFEDHWACEVWSEAEGRWVMVDPQLDALQIETLGVTFDPHDVPADQFIAAGRAWQMCRSGEVDPERFGIFDMHGLWFVWGNLLRDLAALNKMELLPWDCWGLMEADDPGSDENLAVFDRVAELTLGIDDDFGAVRSLYDSDPDLRVPPEIISYGDGRPQIVNLLEGEEFPA